MAKGYKRQDLMEPVVRWRMPGGGGDVSNNPNQWFADRFPEQTQRYGPAFMEGSSGFIMGEG
jgi:hypothetical protein